PSGFGPRWRRGGCTAPRCRRASGSPRETGSATSTPRPSSRRATRRSTEPSTGAAGASRWPARAERQSASASAVLGAEGARGNAHVAQLGVCLVDRDVCGVAWCKAAIGCKRDTFFGNEFHRVLDARDDRLGAIDDFAAAVDAAEADVESLREIGQAPGVAR